MSIGSFSSSAAKVTCQVAGRYQWAYGTVEVEYHRFAAHTPPIEGYDVRITDSDGKTRATIRLDMAEAGALMAALTGEGTG